MTGDTTGDATGKAAEGATVASLNTALAILRTGRWLSAFWVIAAAAQGSGDGTGLVHDLPWMAVFAATAVVVVLVGSLVLDRAFTGVNLRWEIGRANIAAGLVAAAHVAAVAIIAAHCLYGADIKSLAIGIAFVILGVATLAVFHALYRKVTRYDDDQEIKGENIAAAFSNAGLTIALGIIVGHAADGTFTGWGRSLGAYALALVLACTLYPVRQVLVTRLILKMPLTLRGQSLDRAIMEERSQIVGAIEGLSYIITAIVVTRLL